MTLSESGAALFISSPESKSAASVLHNDRAIAACARDNGHNSLPSDFQTCYSCRNFKLIDDSDLPSASNTVKSPAKKFREEKDLSAFAATHVGSVVISLECLDGESYCGSKFLILSSSDSFTNVEALRFFFMKRYQ